MADCRVSRALATQSVNDDEILCPVPQSYPRVVGRAQITYCSYCGARFECAVAHTLITSRSG
jgi:hypothetical protein